MRLLGISVRTLYRWNAGTELADQRRGPPGKPQNALSDQENGLITAVANSPAFRDLSPPQIVPILADSGVYLASEAPFCHGLREGKLLASRAKQAAAAQQAGVTAGAGTESGMDVGHHLPAEFGPRAVLLSVSGSRSMEPKDHGVGGT